MKVFTTLVLTAGLATAALTAHAADRDEQNLAICASKLHESFGDDARYTLVSKRQYQHGTRMKVAARLDADNSKFATCWVSREETAALETPEQQDMLATTESADW